MNERILSARDAAVEKIHPSVTQARIEPQGFRMGAAAGPSDIRAEITRRLEPQQRSRMTRPYQGSLDCVWPIEDGWSVSDKFVNFRRELSAELNRLYPADVGDDGLSRNGFVGDFTPLLSCTGVKMSALAVYDGRPETERASFSSDEAAIARRVFKLMTEAPEFTGHHIPATSTTSLPSFSRDKTMKLQMMASIIADADELADALRHRRSSWLIDAGYAPHFMIGERHQQDGARVADGIVKGKDRRVTHPGRASTLASKETPSTWFGVPAGRVTAMRVRSMCMVAGLPNLALAALISPFRTYLSRYEFTWKHRGPDALAAKISRYRYVLGSDVTTMDQFVGIPWLELWADLWTEVSPPLGAFVRAFNKMSFCFGPPSPSEAGGIVGRIEDAFAADYNVCVGLASGRADNPDFGKWYMTSVYLAVARRALGVPLREWLDVIPAVLRGEHAAFGMLNAGDDNVMLFRDADMYTATRKLVEAGGQTHAALIEPEHGVSFLGNVLTREADAVKAYPNLARAMANRHCPERGWFSPARRFPGEGLIAAERYYSAHPEWNRVRDLELSVWRDCGLALSPVRIAELDMLARGPSVVQAALLGSDLAEHDLAVLLNPDAVHYKVDAADLHPAVSASLSLKVSGAALNPLYTAFGVN